MDQKDHATKMILEI